MTSWWATLYSLLPLSCLIIPMLKAANARQREACLLLVIDPAAADCLLLSAALITKYEAKTFFCVNEVSCICSPTANTVLCGHWAEYREETGMGACTIDLMISKLGHHHRSPRGRTKPPFYSIGSTDRSARQIRYNTPIPPPEKGPKHCPGLKAKNFHLNEWCIKMVSKSIQL